MNTDPNTTLASLDWITVEGFKSIGRLERLPLRAINVLIGPNGSGKSNFLEVFSFLQTLRAGKLQEYVIRAGGADHILYLGTKVTHELKVHLSFSGEVNQYEIRLAATVSDRLEPTTEVVTYGDASTESLFPQLAGTLPSTEVAYHRDEKGNVFKSQSILVPNDGEAGIRNPSARIVDAFRICLDRLRSYHFHDTSPNSSMKRTSDVHDNRYLRPDGSNLAAFLYYLRQEERRAYDVIRQTVRLVAPFFHDFVLEPQALNKEKIRLEWQHRGSDRYFDASSLSDGSLRFIALATLLLQPAQLRPSVILLDEPELGLHPYAITLLSSLVKQAATETQVILATQSPLLLDHFEPEDVLVTNRVDGQSEFIRLDKTDLKTWLQDYSLGQLWEKNEIGGRPTFEAVNDNSAK